MWSDFAIWFLPSGVVILDTAPLRGAVYYNLLAGDVLVKMI